MHGRDPLGIYRISSRAHPSWSGMTLCFPLCIFTTADSGILEHEADSPQRQSTSHSWIAIGLENRRRKNKMFFKNKSHRCRHLKLRKVSRHCHFIEFNLATVCTQGKHFCSGASPCGYPCTPWLSKWPPGHKTWHINIHCKVTLVV